MTGGVDLAAVKCQRCGHSYVQHRPAGFFCPCLVGECDCAAFRWVDPTAPADSYSTRPAPAAP